jgi:hypothetical protein
VLYTGLQKKSRLCIPRHSPQTGGGNMWGRLVELGRGVRVVILIEVGGGGLSWPAGKNVAQ